MDDRRKIVDELQKHSHPLTDHSDILYNIVNGQLASAENVNVRDAIQIGQDMQKRFTESLPDVKLQLSTFCFDLINNNLPAYFINMSSLLQPVIYHHNIRQKRNYSVARVKHVFRIF